MPVTVPRSVPYELSATELAAAYRRGELSPVDATEAILARIEAVDGSVNAFVTVTAERALADARAAELSISSGESGPLAGIPYTLKDMVVTKGIPTGRGSLVWNDPSPAADAPVAERLAAAGGVLLGKTTTPELGWKGDSGNRRNGPCHNPRQHGRTAGGSSGGAAAAAAGLMGPLHQGSDGAGSIRIPAGFCGVVGLKPTFGLTPQYPPSAVEPLSHIGPITRTVADAALMLDAMAGIDERDRATVPLEPAYAAALEQPLPPLRIAFSRDLGYGLVDPAVADAAASAASVFRDLGHTVDEPDLDLDDPFWIVDAIWSTGMAALHRDRFADVRDRLDPGLVRVIEAGLRVDGPTLAAAIQGRLRFCDAVREAMAGYDLLMTPTLPCTAFAAGDDQPTTIAGTPVSYLGWTVFTYPFNITGQPAITMPCGEVGGLPVGLQIVGRRFEDALVLRAAMAYEASS